MKEYELVDQTFSHLPLDERVIDFFRYQGIKSLNNINIFLRKKDKSTKIEPY